MAIKAYVGIMGSGKTYEVVTVVILNAIRQGRRVVSNIAGLNYDEMRKLLVAEGLEETALGQLINVTHDKVKDPDFWRTDKDEEQGIEAFIHPGDLVALDEIWRFWDGFALKDENGLPRPARIMNFFRMHRHFPHPETGVTCDVAIITQDVMDIHRSVRAVIEEIYRMEMLTTVGLSSRYRVDIFKRARIVKTPLRSLQRAYESKYFPLYTSNSQQKEGDASARETNIDKRGNILSGKLFLFFIPLLLAITLFSLFFVWKFLHPAPSNKSNSAPEQTSSKEPISNNPAPVANNPPVPSDKWRIAGFYRTKSSFTLVLRNDAGTHRYIVDPPNIRVAGLDVGAVLGDEVFSNWSGAENADRAKMPQP
jgi:zona occludens toxin